MFALAVIFSIISVVAILGVASYLKRTLTASARQQGSGALEEIHQLEKNLAEAIKYPQHYASRKQYEVLVKMLERVERELEGERAALKEIESKLGTAQHDVESKEALQQELKSAREDEDLKLQEILANFATLSEESIALESRLAECLKSLDQISSQLNLTDEQRAMLQEFASALESSGSLLRELIFEYRDVKERLKMLQQQHEDLEEEYTKLVEQQLGE